MGAEPQCKTSVRSEMSLPDICREADKLCNYCLRSKNCKFLEQMKVSNDLTVRCAGFLGQPKEIIIERDRKDYLECPQQRIKLCEGERVRLVW